MKKRTALFLVIVLALSLLPVSASANASEPPQLIILVMNGPEDLTITLCQSDGVNEGKLDLPKGQVAYEQRFVWEAWTARDIRPQEGWEGPVQTTLEVRGTGVEWNVPLDDSAYTGYNSLVTLNAKTGELSIGQPPWRIPLLVGIRVLCTLVIEGVVFYLFGYRRKSSWAIFLVTNLLTQTGLNLLMSIAEFSLYVMTVLVYMFGEPLIFVTEMLIFALLLREKKCSRGALCALAANAASLIFGALLILWIPI